MAFVSFEFDRWFCDFNFSEVLDPDLRPGNGPGQLELIQLVQRARGGDRFAKFEFTDTMYWTLRPEAFECFQRAHGPRPISYRDWFYAKLRHFFRILVYETLNVDGLGPDGKPKTAETDRPWEEGLTVLGPGGAAIEDEEIELTFSPTDNEPCFWGAMVDEVCEASEGRLAVLEAILGRLRRQRGRVGSGELAGGDLASIRPVRDRKRSRERNQVIRRMLKDGKDGLEICVELDRRGIELLPILRQHGILSWVAGWNDDRAHNNIQQLFSKQGRKV